jgi:hypothetical protein
MGRTWAQSEYAAMDGQRQYREYQERLRTCITPVAGR